MIRLGRRMYIRKMEKQVYSPVSLGSVDRVNCVIRGERMTGMSVGG